MKRVILCLFLLALALPARAQGPENPKRTVLIPQIGFNFAFLTDDPVAEAEDLTFDASSLVGWQFGADLRIGRRTWLQPGLFYQYLGTELEGPPEDVGGAADVITDNNTIHSLHVPLQAGVNVVDTTPLVLNLHGGASGTFLLSVPDNALGIEKDDMKSAVWGIMIGAGVEFVRLHADLSYEFGLSRVYENDAAETKRNVLRFDVGLAF
jgi:hypothetical protein